MRPTINDTDGRTERAENDGDTLDPPEGVEDGRAPGTTGPGRSERGTICVVGLGYVGLPLAVGFARADHGVIGYDVDDGKIETLRDGVDTTGDLDGAVDHENVTYTANPVEIGRADYVILAVPTPVDDDRRPDLEFVRSAGETVGAHLTPGTTVILESTVYPGATREVLVPAIEEASGLACGEDFFVGYSPERAAPGDREHDLRNVVKVVSGQDAEVLERVATLYESVVDAEVYRAPSIEVAEAAKVVENVQRDLNIALVNELSMAFERMGIDTRAVLEAAGTKWNFHDYRPGLVGGHCIPVDPYYLTYRAKREGFVPELVLAGREVNESMPAHVATVTIKALNENEKTLKGSRVLVLGLTYKAGVADIRTSKVEGVVEHLREYGIDVVGFDPYGDDEAMAEAFGIEIQETLSFEGVDGVVLATPHPEFEELDVAEMATRLDDDPALVDVAGTFDPGDVEAQGVSYRRV